MNYSWSLYRLLVLPVAEQYLLLLSPHVPPASLCFLIIACQALHWSGDFGNGAWEKELSTEMQPSSFPARAWSFGPGQGGKLVPVSACALWLRAQHKPLVSQRTKVSSTRGEQRDVVLWIWLEQRTNFHFQLPLIAPQLGVSARPWLRPHNKAQAFPSAFLVVALANVAVLQGGPSQINRSSFPAQVPQEPRRGQWAKGDQSGGSGLTWPPGGPSPQGSHGGTGHGLAAAHPSSSKTGRLRLPAALCSAGTEGRVGHPHCMPGSITPVPLCHEKGTGHAGKKGYQRQR